MLHACYLPLASVTCTAHVTLTLTCIQHVFCQCCNMHVVSTCTTCMYTHDSCYRHVQTNMNVTCTGFRIGRNQMCATYYSVIESMRSVTGTLNWQWPKTCLSSDFHFCFHFLISISVPSFSITHVMSELDTSGIASCTCMHYNLVTFVSYLFFLYTFRIYHHANEDVAWG